MTKDNRVNVDSSNPTIHDKSHSRYPGGAVSDYLRRVVDEIDREQLSPEDRTRLLQDHLTGSILRTLGVSEGQSVLRMISDRPGDDRVDPTDGNSYPWTSFITRRGGIRQVVVDIDRKTEDRGVFAGLSNSYRVSYDTEGQPAASSLVLTSVDQIAAYLNTETPAEAELKSTDRASSWKRIILEEISKYLSIAGRKEAWKAADNLGSEVASVRQAQQGWLTAVKIAVEAGVDIDFITRSAEDMWHRQEAGQHVGHAALLEVFPDLGSLLRD